MPVFNISRNKLSVIASDQDSVKITSTATLNNDGKSYSVKTPSLSRTETDPSSQVFQKTITNSETSTSKTAPLKKQPTYTSTPHLNNSTSSDDLHEPVLKGDTQAVFDSVIKKNSNPKENFENRTKSPTPQKKDFGHSVKPGPNDKSGSKNSSSKKIDLGKTQQLKFNNSLVVGDKNSIKK